jgi:uncharacterized protein YidB (DUF937 family)
MGILDDLLAGAAGAPPRNTGAPTRRAGASPALLALLPILLSLLANRGGRQRAPAGGGPGGSLGDVLGQVLGGRGGSGGGLGDVLGQVFGGAGGLGGLLEQLERGGFGGQGRSWVGTGQNQPLSPDAIGQIFGRDGLGAIAQQAGLSEQDAADGLAKLLPEVVDHLTPQGQVPGPEQLTRSLDQMLRRLGG